MALFVSTVAALAYAPGLARTPGVVSRASALSMFDQEAFIAESKEMRLKHLEEQVHTEQPAELRRSPG